MGGRGTVFGACLGALIMASLDNGMSLLNVRDFMQDANPAALRETAARFAEAIRRGLWTPRSNRAADLIAELLPHKEIA